MRSLVPTIALSLLVGGCGAAMGGAGDFREGFGAAASAPLTDLNLQRERIPTILLQAEANPYDLRNLDRCSTIAAEIGRLNGALGRDLDEPPPPDGSTRSERAADAASSRLPQGGRHEPQLRPAGRAGLVPARAAPPLAAVGGVPGVEVAAEGLESPGGDGVAHGRRQGLEEGDVVPAQQHLAEDLIRADQVMQISL